MGEPVIIDAVRTPIGKRGGALAGVVAPRLLAVSQQALLDRNGLAASDVDQLIGGCVTQAGQQGSNVTRNAWLSTGTDFTAAATTIDCQCGSGLQANNFMQGLIATGGARSGIACGVEQMSQVPLGTAARGGGGYYKDDTWPWDDPDHGQFGAAQRIAEKRGINRDDVERGQVLAKPGSITPHTEFMAEVYVLKKEEGGRHTPFFNGYRPQFYFRTTDVTGVVTLPEGVEMVMPGDNVNMKVVLIAPVALENGSRFAIREGGRTVGAGVITEIIN